MLLVIDVGNTETAFGVYRDGELIWTARSETRAGRTADEIAVTLRSLLELAGLTFGEMTEVALASVVPALTQRLVTVCDRYLGTSPLVVGPGIKTGMPLLNDNPREVGADRIVNAVAAYERFRDAVVVVDFGTATTLDFVDAEGRYTGGIIAPGLQVAADTLFARAAKLPRVETAKPPTVVGKNTVHGIQSGLYYGYAAMVDGLVGRIATEVQRRPRVIATGGLAVLIARDADSIEEVDEELTIRGLWLIQQRNR